MAKKKNVTFSGDPVSKQVKTTYEDVLSKYAKELDTDIELVLCHANYDKVPRDLNFDKLYIFAQLLPKTFEGVSKSRISYFQINKEKLELPVKKETASACPQGDSLRFSKPSGETYVINDSANQPIAVVEDCSLYILNDFVHSRSKAELEISLKVFHFIMKETIIKSNLMKYMKSGIEEKSKRALKEALKVQFISRLEKEKIQLKAAADTMSQYSKGIVECQRKVLAGEKIIIAIQNNLKDIPVALDKKWAAINKLSSSNIFENISFMRTGIRAISTPIVIKHGSKEYDMGRYEVILGFNGETKIDGIDPQNSTGDATCHPHVRHSKPCWGNMAGTLPKLIGSSEIDVALVMVHTFLSNYDSASPYKNIESWPIKGAKKKSKVKELEPGSEEGREDDNDDVEELL